MQVSAIDAGFIANLLKGSMNTGLKQSIDEKRHGTALVFIGDTDAICDSLHVTNKLVGHVFLVDSAGRIRWHGWLLDGLLAGAMALGAG